MKKEFYFKTPYHFSNFCYKYIDIDDSDLEALAFYVERAIDGDTIWQTILNRFTAILKFEPKNYSEAQNIIAVARELFYYGGSIKETLEMYHIVLNPFGDVKAIFVDEDYTLSDEFINELQGLILVHGLYFLYSENKELIYIGKSKNLSERIPTSVKERKAHYLKYKLTNTMADANILELYYISKLKPILNKDSKENDDTSIEINYSFKKESDFIKIRGDK